MKTRHSSDWPDFRSPILLAVAVIGIALVLSCSKDVPGSEGGAGGHGSGSGGGPVGGTGAGGTASSTGGTTGAGVGGRTAGTGGATDAGATGAGGGGAGGSADGGVGGSATTCPLPSTFRWTSSGPLAQPKAGLVSLKDFSSVVFNNQHIVYMSTVSSAESYGLAMMTFTDWPQMATATQNVVPGVAAPALIRFTPKNIWVLMYEWGPWAFTYQTATDPTNPSGWSAPHDLYDGSSIDETVLCDSTTCYLFFANDNGNIYRASMPIGNFPGTFTNPTTVLTDTRENLFEAVQVYTVKGANKYLMLVEAIGGAGRYFRSFTATDLGGAWTPLAATESNPFAGKANVTFNGTAWTSDISSGDLVRDNPDETQTVDPCNLQLLYQGLPPSPGLTYNQLPWQPGLLTLVQ